MHCRSAIQSNFRLIALLLLAWSCAAESATGYRWKVIGANGGAGNCYAMVGQYFTTGSAAGLASGSCNAAWGDFYTVPSYSGSVNAGKPASAGLTGGARACNATATTNCTGYVGLISESYTYTDACSAMTGKLLMMWGDSVENNTCQEGCNYAYNNGVVLGAEGGLVSWNAFGDGSSCGEADPARTPVTEAPTSQNCIVKNGAQICLTQKDTKNCGTYNGDYVCVDTLKPGECKTYASGGMACSSTAGAPPAPDNGTEGTPATPTLSITESSTTTNYFNSTTVNNSAGAATGSGGGESGDTNPDATGSGGTSGDSGEGGASGGATCTEAPSCSGDSVQCAQLFQAWKQRCETVTDSEILEAAGVPTDDSEDSVTNQSVEVGDFNTIGWLGSDECLEDLVLDLDDYGTYTIPISDFCWILQAVGSMMMLLGMWQGSKIVIGGLNGGF